MAIFTCKMCGGALEIKEGMSVCECQYCGTLQMFPNLDDEKKIRLYDRANHFRRNNDSNKEYYYNYAKQRVAMGLSCDNLSSAIATLKKIVPYKDSEQLIIVY